VEAKRFTLLEEPVKTKETALQAGEEIAWLKAEREVDKANLDAMKTHLFAR
jgi:hypothetical protein